MTKIKIRTVNAEMLKATLATLPRGVHEVLLDTESAGVVEVETTNPGFLTFACKNQGYGEVVES